MSNFDDVQRMIAEECDSIKELLLEKNRRYGNAALEPEQVDGEVIPPETGIKVRIGDKLKRWKKASKDEDEDVVKDLIGYLVLLRVARRLDAIAEHREKPSCPACGSYNGSLGTCHAYFICMECGVERYWTPNHGHPADEGMTWEQGCKLSPWYKDYLKHNKVSIKV